MSLCIGQQCKFQLYAELAQRWLNLTMAHWQHVISRDDSRIQLYPVDGRLKVHLLLCERFQQRCQTDRVQAGGGLVHVWGAFRSGARSPLVLPDRYFTSEIYRGILWSTLVSFARQNFRDNYHCQDDNTTPLCASGVLDFLQQGNVTKMNQPARSPETATSLNIFGMRWAMQAPVLTTWPRILMSSTKPC